MADIKVCDRCGVTLSDTKRAVFSVKPAMPARFTLKVSLRKTDTWREHVVYTEWDLCPECVQKLSDWMTEMKTEE